MPGRHEHTAEPRSAEEGRASGDIGTSKDVPYLGAERNGTFKDVPYLGAERNGTSKDVPYLGTERNGTSKDVPYLGVEREAAQPQLLYPPYRSTIRRAPLQPLVTIPANLTNLAAPVYGLLPIAETDNDLTRQHAGEPQGQRIIVAGRVVDDRGRPVPHTLVEIWQCNAAGRYAHAVDDHPAPLDPNFTGAGRMLTDAEGRYQFVTIKPGAYPWRNHPNAWRPAHIHFSLFGVNLASRLVTQMYFPNDPLFPYDPIFQGIPDEGARQRLISAFDLDLTKPEWALGYRFDIVLRGDEATPFEART